uniref:Uncharacterized protein n=1 Tax=Falco tinnunculus TaxID=100819 RepID=A0A8C4UZ64_FALTI
PAGPSSPQYDPGMAAADGDDSLYPIAVLIDELRNEDVQVPGHPNPPPGSPGPAAITRLPLPGCRPAPPGNGGRR